MIDINLLPWRDLQRTRVRKQFTLFSSGLLLSVVSVISLMNYYAHRLLSNQLALNQRVQEDLSILNKQLQEIERLNKTKIKLVSQITAFKKLQATRSLTLHLFDELVKLIPEKVYLMHVLKVRNRVTLMGYAESNSRVALLLQRMDQKSWIKEVLLEEIKANKPAQDVEGDEFKLSFVVDAHLLAHLRLK